MRPVELEKGAAWYGRVGICCEVSMRAGFEGLFVSLVILKIPRIVRRCRSKSRKTPQDRERPHRLPRNGTLRRVDRYTLLRESKP